MDQKLIPLIKNRSTPFQNRCILIESRSTLIESGSTLIECRSTLIEDRSTLIKDRSTLIESQSTLIATRSTLIESRSTLIESRSTLIKDRSTLIEGSVDVDRKSFDVDRISFDVDQESFNVDRKCIEIRTLEGSHPRQLLLGVTSRIHLGVRLGDLALLVDHIRDPFGVFVFRRHGGAVGDADFAVGVAEQGEGEVELIGEAGVGIHVVETGAEDGGVLRFVLLNEVPEPGTLGRSAGCVGLRIEPEHDLAAAQVVERDITPAVIGNFEVRGLVANVKHA